MDKSLYVYVKLIDAGFSVEAFNNGKQFNVRDKNGIIQSFYTSGTIVAHDANNKIYSIREKTVVDFINLLNNPETLNQLIGVCNE